MVKVSDVIVDFLIENKIEVVFGIIGSANSHIFESINQKSHIKLVSVHHEQAAVMAMGAYYRATGKLSVALVTAGGGSSNAFTGILSNWADSIPGIIISGQEQTYYIEEYRNMRMFGVQGYDSIDTFSKHTKLSARVDRDNVYEIFHKAFEITKSGRPGPVFLEIPFDTQSQLIEEQVIASNKLPMNVLNQLCSASVDDIISKLNIAKRPVIVAGHGIKLSDSVHLFNALIDKWNIPTILTWSGVDILAHDHKSNYGRSGVQGQRSSNFIIQNSDLLIVLGSRLSLLQTGYSRDDFAPNAHIIHVDIDHTETNKFRGSYTSINENVRDIMHDFIFHREYTADISEWIDYCDRMRQEYPTVMPEHIADPTNSYSFIDKFSERLPDQYVIVTDMGTALLSGFYGFKIKKHQTMFTSLGLGEMGYGLAAAVGAGFGKRPVMCLNCDGGMMMNIQELQTIKTHNLPVKIVIFNNDGYLMIKHTQKMLFGDNKTCVDKSSGVTLPDYKKVAAAFDFSYYTEDQLEDFLNDDNQAFLEVFMDPNQEFIPKVRGMKMQDGTIKAGLLEDMSPLLPLKALDKVMLNEVNERSKTAKR